MKKLCMLFLCVSLMLNTFCVFAEMQISDLIDKVREDTNVDMSLIDESSVVYAEITGYINLAKGIQPTSFYLFMASVDSKDYYTAGFDKNEYVSTVKNFSATEPLKYYSLEEAKSYMLKNGLNEPDEVKAILTHGRIGLFAYNVLCEGETYIIPYYFTNDSTYNITQDETCNLKIGTAYTVDEFVEISEKEHELYNAYMTKKNAERGAFTAKNYEGEIIEAETKKDNKSEREIENNNEEEAEPPKNAEQTADKEKTENEQKETKAENNDIVEHTETEVSFVDVPATHWAYNEITDLASNNIILGYGNGYFGVNDSVTHEQLSLLLKRQFNYDENNTESIAAKRENVIVSLVKAMNVNLSNVNIKVISEKFSDGNTVSEGNKKYIAYAIETKLVVGYDGRLNLDSNVTRAETACLIHRAMNAIE